MDHEMKTKVALVSLYNREFAFGVRYLSSTLKERGHRSDIVFFKQMTSISDAALCLELVQNSNFCEPHTPLEIDILTQTLRDLKPDLIGLSLMSPFYRLAVEITEAIKKEINIPIIWGGVHPTLLPEECIKHADMVCVGEGEGAIVNLADALYEGRSISSIPNLWIKTDAGKVLRNELRPLITDLDSLGFPDFSDDDHKYYIEDSTCTKSPPEKQEHSNEAFNIMTSRGCPYRCSYCCVHILRKMFKGKGPYVRRRSAKSVVDELTSVLKFGDGINHIHFWDDVFTFDKKWIEEFSEEYKRRIGLPFTCYAHPEYTDYTILKRLKDAGLKCINMGIQSGSQRIYKDLYCRKTSNEKILYSARLLKKLNLLPWYDLIVDNPYENDEDFRATLELLLNLPLPFNLNIHSLCFFPKTELAEKALKDGLITEEDIEGANTKAIDQFRMSLDRKRSSTSLFWNILIGMTRHEFFSRGFIRSCSRSKILRKCPTILRFFVVNTLRFICKMQTFKKIMRGRVKLEIVEFKRIFNPQFQYLHIHINNLTRRHQETCLALRVYPAKRPVFPERYFGAWNLSLRIPPEGLSIEVENSFPDVRFMANNEKLEASECWVGAIREPGLYIMEAILLNKNHIIHNKLLYCY
ncbi:MAG: B12-binding domain-containing radical SAM protein, partial [Thermoplasmata archaeon]